MDNQDQAEQGKPGELEPTANVGTGDSDNEQDIFEAASHETSDYSAYTPKLKPDKKWPKIVGRTLAGIIVAVGLGVGGYLAIKHMGSTPSIAQTNKVAHKQQGSAKASGSADQTQASNAAAVSMKQYSSTNFRLSFSYPAGWTVADTGNGKLTVTSPATQLTAASGQAQSGQIVMSIQNQTSADMSAFKQGAAVAVLDSQKIMYTSPTTTQRAATYLSFLQYAATTTQGALDGIYITGDFGYQKGQTIPESDIAKVDPLVRVTFLACSDANCKTATPLNIGSSAWSDGSFSTPIEDMLKSLAFQ